MEEAIEEKYHQLRQNLEDMGSILLAFSGGVDSTLLLAVGKDVLGENILAATVQSPVHPRAATDFASAMAARLKAEQLIVTTDELASEAFVANPPERCYLCKHDRFGKLVDIAAREGISEIVEGTQSDDTRDYRPGLEAVKELGIRSPLLDLDMGKYEVRAISRELGLPTWNMPASTCLATRVPYGETITREKLGVIERAEEYLVDLGLKQVRVRYIEDRTARIEVSPSAIATLAADGTRERIVEKMGRLGFVYVTLDLAGYRTGALNEVLP